VAPALRGAGQEEGGVAAMGSRRALIIGAGSSGIVTAKELMDVGIDDVVGGLHHQYVWLTA